MTETRFPPRGSLPADAVTADGGTSGPSVEEQLVRKQAEVEQLFSAMRHRAVIEQAKGVLMGWLGVDAERAFGHLVGYSQRNNRRLSEAAAALVAYARERRPASDEAAALPDDRQLFAEASQRRLQELLGDSAIAAAPDLEHLLREVRATLEPPPDGMLLGALEPDGAVRVLVTFGYPASTISGWERIPPRADVPIADAATTGRALFFADRDERIAAYPGSRHLPAEHTSMACVPVVLAGRSLGVLGLTWGTPLTFDAERRRVLQQLGERCSRPLADHLRHLDAHDVALPGLTVDPGRDRWLQAAFDQIPSPIAVLDPVLDDAADLIDVMVVHLNPASTRHLDDPTLPIGRSLLDLSPWVGNDVLWSALRTVLADGIPQRLPRYDVQVNIEGRRDVVLHDLGIARIGGMLLLTWSSTELRDRAGPATG
ncbi:ANTAR domain-containing protein [Egicoccus sp. AB-alg2]|uniref:GAF and ANTAR domain-containing protein n=1 Tax=Egicoccus sp. AB-alg2 TaxID=3242693 RepID=UPI00359E88DF